MSTNQLAFFFDQTRCGACNACTVACKDWNQVNPGLARWRKQYTYETDKGFFPFAFGCNHCDEPACMTACPYLAITKDPKNGVVTVDRVKCQGNKACVTACPYAKPQIADDKQETPLKGWTIRHPMQKCTMCSGDRLKAGLKPACVLSCIGRALDIGTVAEIQAKYPDAVRLNANDFPYVYVNNKNDTKPNLFVKKLPERGAAGGMKLHKSPEYTGKKK